MAIEDLIKAVDDYDREQLDLSMSGSVSKNPDQSAKIFQLSKEKNLPADYVERNFDKVSAPNVSNVGKGVAQLLRDRKKAAMAHDDIDNLSWWETTAQEAGNIGKLVPSAAKSISSAGYSAIGSTFNSLAELSYAIDTTLGVSQEDIDKGDFLGAAGKYMLDIARIERADAEYYFPKKSILSDPVLGGVKSAMISMPAMAAGVLARNPKLALGALGGVTYGDSYLTAKDAGLDEMSSMSYASNQMIAEVVTEKIPLGRLLKDLDGNTGFLKTVATQMAIEIPSEQVATVWQDALDWAVINPDKTLREFIDERPDAAVNTLISTIVATGIQTSAISGIDRLTRVRESEKIQEISDKANESKLRGRAPEVFADYINDLTEEYGSPDAIYIDAKEIKPLFQGMEKDAAYDLIASQIDEAEAVGGDIVIPMKDFVTTLATSKNFESIKGTMRLSAESPTASQLEGQPQRISDLIDTANKNIATKTRADEIYKEVTKQLINTGRMNADVAKTSASIIPAYVTTKSIRSGLSVDEVYGMMGLKIEGTTKQDETDKVLSQRSLSEWDDILRGLDYADSKPQQGKDDATEFLSNAPAGTRYTDESKLLKRVRKSSDEIYNELSGSPEAGRVGKTSLGQFTSYRTQADIIEPDSIYPDGRIQVQVFGKEQDEQGLNAEPALIFTVSKDGELSVNGPTGETFDLFKEAGWAKESTGKSGEIQTGWTSLVNKDGSQMPLSQLLPLISDVHARVRAWRGDDKIGLHWSRSTGATGGIVGGRQTAVFFQDSKGQTETKAFKKWFGDSKVVDENGKPLVVYHGSESAGFSEFSDKGIGSFFSSSRLNASTYSGSRAEVENGARQPGVYSVYLKIENPLVVNWNGKEWYQGESEFEKTDDAAKFAKANGYDGVILREVKDPGSDNYSHVVADIYVAFEPTQIKSATGNQGTFDPNDPSILKQDARGYYDPSAGIIKLGKASDLSTFLHESGHLFLEMEGRLFSHPNATPEMKADGQVILDWLGIESFDQLKDYETNDVSREAHEKFARGFERYLGEGKAPSVELKSVFRRFAAWMRQVYRDLKKLNVELTDGVRAVMDRMLATDDQISRLSNGFDPLFKTAKEAGMTEPEFKAYSAEASPDSAKEVLLAKMIKQLNRQYTKWWKDESAVVAERVRKEVEAQPLYSALSSMRGGGTTKEAKALSAEIESMEEQLRKLTRNKPTIKQAIARAGGINRKDAIDNGIDAEYVKARFVSQGKPLFPKSGGLSFDGIAELLNQEGYSLDANSALDLVQSVLASDQFVDMDINAQAENLQKEISIKSADLSEFGANRLNYDDVHTHFFGDIPGRFIGLTSKNGSNPDDIAAIHGLASGSELLDLINTEPTLAAKVKQLTEQEMISRHGDILNDGTIREEAEQALRNPEHAKKLIAELNALSRKTKTTAIDRESIKAYAQETIAKMAVSKIRPNQYRAAEVRAAREAAIAKSKGDFEAAQKAKTQELINFYLSREASLAKEKAERIRASQKAIQARKYSASNIDMEYVNEAKILLRAYDFRKTSEQDMALSKANIERARMWIESQQKDPNTVATFVQAEILGKLIPYSDMTLEDLQGLDDVVKSILHAGRGLAEENKEIYRANIDQGKESIIKNRIDTYETEADSGIPWVQAKSLFNEATASLRKFESFARQADGMNEQGWVWRNTVKPLLDAANEKIKRQRIAHSDLREIFQGFNNAFSHMRGIKTFNTEAGQKIRLSYGARISIALNLGNDGNLDALKTMDKLPLTDADISNITSSLSEADWGLVQRIWDYIDTYWPEISALEIKRSGVAPMKVQSRAFVTPSGIEMRGGYYPLAGDAAADGKQLEQDIDTMASAMMNGGASSKSTKHGSTIERVGFGGKKIDFSIGVLFNHIDGVVHDITHWKAVKDVDRVLKNEKINSELSASLGLAGVKAMKQRLKEIAAGPQRLEGLGWVNRVLRHARLASTYSALGYSVRTAIMNTMGITTAVADMSLNQVASGAVEYYSNITKMNQLILDKSEYMRDRGLTLNRDIAYIRANLRGDNAFTKFKEGAFWMMTQMDKAITRPIWLSAYREGEMMFKTEKEAIDYADRMVARTQGSGMDLDLSNVETKNELMKTMTVMYTAFSAIYNISTEQTKRYKAGKISGTNLAWRMAWLTVVPGILTSLLTGSDDDEPEDVLWEVAGQGIGMIPIARDAFSYARYGASFPTPIVRLAISPIKFAGQLSQGEIDKGLVGATAEMASWLHIPGGAQLTRTYGYLSDIQDGEIEEFSPIDLLITGKE